MTWVKNAALSGEDKSAQNMIVKPETKRLLERSRHKRYDHIENYLKNRWRGQDDLTSRKSTELA
jgi:hypothetical protein